MSTAFHLAGPDDLDRLTSLVAAFHAEIGISQSDEARHAGLSPLLEGSPYGVAYLLGPRRAPVGYIVVTFGWSVEFGGMDAFVDEIYIRPAVRGRGMGTEVLVQLPKALAGAGLRAFHLEVDRTDESTQKIYHRAGFRLRDRYALMTRDLT